MAQERSGKELELQCLVFNYSIHQQLSLFLKNRLKKRKNSLVPASWMWIFKFYVLLLYVSKLNIFCFFDKTRHFEDNIKSFGEHGFFRFHRSNNKLISRENHQEINRTWRIIISCSPILNTIPILNEIFSTFFKFINVHFQLFFFTQSFFQVYIH